jgi:myb proto-oncogene protein
LKKKLFKAEGMESPNKTQSASSNSDNMDLSPSPKRLKMQSPESSMNMEKPSTDIDRPVLPRMFDYLKEPNRSSLLPKVMFAEWLSLDSFASSGEPVVSKSTFDHNPSFQDTSFMHHYLLEEGAFGGDYQNSLSDGSSGDIFSSEFKFESQSPGNEFDFSSGEDLCREFNFRNIGDVMYI